MFEVLELVEDKSSLLNREQHFIDILHAHTDGYNLRPIAANNMGLKFSEDSKSRMSAHRRGKPKPPRTKEHCARMSAAKLGTKHTEEARLKIGAAQLGRKRSEETCKKIGAVHLGRKRSEESRARMSAARKRYFAERKEHKCLEL